MTLADVDSPVARDGSTDGFEARATEIEFTDIGVRLEQGDRIETPTHDKVFHSAVMDDDGMWTILYARNCDVERGSTPGGHGHGWLRMKLRTGEWSIADTDAERPGVQDL